MTESRDTANEIYTPRHRARPISGTGSAPTLETDGFDCTGSNFLLVSTTLGTATAHQFKVHMWDGASWKEREDTSTIGDTDLFDPEENFEQNYVTTNFFRYAVEYTTVTGGTLTSVENLSV